MQKINPENYSDYISYADINDCGKVYPLSIAEGIQSGDIFVNSINDCRSALFWHYCGFAYLSGKSDIGFLEDVYKLMLNADNEYSRRFILLDNNEHTEKFFRSKDDIIVERRYIFEYTNKYIPFSPDLPQGYELREIDSNLLSKLLGSITPALFWSGSDDFLENGKGYCIVENRNVAAWAFSAAISSTEIDIGIETDENYRNRGLASACAKRMIEYSFENGKKPVWACHYKNIASEKTAEKIGFTKNAECFIIKINN